MKTLTQKLINSKTLMQLIKFGTVGVVNTLVDFGMYWILILIYQHSPALNMNTYGNALHSFLAGYYANIAQTISYLLAVLGSYFLNKYWTFNAADQKNAAAIVKMYTLSAVCFCLLQAMLWFWLNIAKIESEMLAKLFATVPITVLNFLGSKFWVFRNKKETI